MNYGAKLKELRTSELLTQKDIANTLSISRSTYKDYELQIKIIPINHLNNICNYFHISIDYLFGLSSIKQYQNQKDNFSYDIFSNRETLKKLIYFLNSKYGIKYVKIRDFFEIPRGIMDTLKR